MSHTLLTEAEALRARAVLEMASLLPEQRERLQELHAVWRLCGVSDLEAAQNWLSLASLVRKGIVTHLPNPRAILEPRPAPKPITVIGKPISETLLEDREPR